MDEPVNNNVVENENDKTYFGKREEAALNEYLNSTDQSERDAIFNSILRPAFTKMIEALIRRYKLFTIDEEFEDTFNDTMSFLMMKINNFDASKGYKAYSYCGTVCKNYLIRKRKDSQKKEATSFSYDAMYGSSNPDTRQDDAYENEVKAFNDGLIKKITHYIKESVDNKEEQNLTENEYKVGVALIELLENWETIFDASDMGDTRKYNKTSVLYYLKENTFLKTKEVRDAMKRYKLLYEIIKEDYIKDNE